MRGNGRRGFSLLELLLVMGLAPILFFSVFSNFNTGVKLWAKIVQQTPEEDLNIFSFKVRRDIEHVLPFSPVPFEGDERQIVFPAAVETKPELGGKHGIGEIRLFYDTSANAIVREERNLSEFYRDAAGRHSVLLRNVSAFEFSYLSKDPLQSTHTWTEYWKPSPKNLPVAVKMSFELEHVPGKLERVVFVPIGGEKP